MSIFGLKIFAGYRRTLIDFLASPYISLHPVLDSWVLLMNKKLRREEIHLIWLRYVSAEFGCIKNKLFKVVRTFFEREVHLIENQLSFKTLSGTDPGKEGGSTSARFAHFR